MYAKLQVVLHVLVLLQVVWVEAACGKRSRRKREHKHLHYEDCGRDPYRPIQFVHLAATPNPIITPGRLRFSFKLNISEDLPENFLLNVTVAKRIQLFGSWIDFNVPCIEGKYGTCVYRDVCRNLNSMFPSNCDCPDPLILQGIPCTCPILAGEYTMNNVDVHVPKLEGMLGTLAQGDYLVRLRVQGGEMGEELGCLSVKLAIRKRKPRNGWFFGSRYR